jgi:adenylate cyclase
LFTKRRTRLRAVVAGFTGLAFLSGALLLAFEVLDTTLQTAVYDTSITLSPAKVRNQITIVAIDDPTVARYGAFPLPRTAYAELLRALRPLQPSVIAFDVSFYEPAANPEDDRQLADAIRDVGNVLLPMQGTGDALLGDHTESYAAINLPIPVLRAAAAGVAAVNIHPDPDGRVRYSPLRITGPDGTTYYSLPLLTAAMKLRGDLSSARREDDRFVVPAPLGDRVMPIDRRGAMEIYYAAEPAKYTAKNPSYPCGSEKEFCVVSLRDVVAGSIPRDLIAGRAVLVGAHSISAVPDDYHVPNSKGGKMYGVEIWANATQSIFTNRYPVLRQGLVASLAELVLMSLIGMLLVLRWRLAGLVGAALCLAVYVVGAYVLFALQTGGLVGVGPVEVPSIAYVLTAPVWWVLFLAYLVVEEQVTIARTRSTFGRFVTPAVARTIMEREEAGKLALGGEEKRVTVLFGDIRGFTTMSEGMIPSTLLHHLNRFFDGMVDIVNRYEGTVNKFNGDSIMVLWGAPLEMKDHARKAAACALEMQTWVVAERERGGPDISFGFGINSGAAVAGFLGAKGRMEYTVVGDTVNVASRLTSSDIARRDQVVCSGETLRELGDDVEVVDLGATLVRGRIEPVPCWQINRVGALRAPTAAPPPDLMMRRSTAGYR